MHSDRLQGKPPQKQGRNTNHLLVSSTLKVVQVFSKVSKALKLLDRFNYLPYFDKSR